MEARLVYAHKVKKINSDEREWRIINPHHSGIRVDETRIPAEYTQFFTANIAPDVSHFLTEITGAGGPWDGWTLYAVGRLMKTQDDEPTPYFQTVFVRKERAAHGFEMVEEMGTLQ